MFQGKGKAVVAAIMGAKKVEDQWQFLVRWKGDATESWVAKDCLANHPCTYLWECVMPREMVKELVKVPTRGAKSCDSAVSAFDMKMLGVGMTSWYCGVHIAIMLLQSLDYGEHSRPFHDVAAGQISDEDYKGNEYLKMLHQLHRYWQEMAVEEGYARGAFSEEQLHGLSSEEIRVLQVTRVHHSLIEDMEGADAKDQRKLVLEIRDKVIPKLADKAWSKLSIKNRNGRVGLVDFPKRYKLEGVTGAEPGHCKWWMDILSMYSYEKKTVLGGSMLLQQQGYTPKVDIGNGNLKSMRNLYATFDIARENLFGKKAFLLMKEAETNGGNFVRTYGEHSAKEQVPFTKPHAVPLPDGLRSREEGMVARRQANVEKKTGGAQEAAQQKLDEAHARQAAKQQGHDAEFDAWLSARLADRDERRTREEITAIYQHSKHPASSVGKAQFAECD
jgi:hypothetical protein